MYFDLDEHHRNVSDAELLDDLKLVASTLKKSKVTIDEYNERGRFHATTLTRRFGSWFVALQMAGLEMTRNLNISDEALFENMVDVWINLGKQPRYKDLTRDVSRFSAGTYEKRFGGWRNSLEKLVDWANQGKFPIDGHIQKQNRTNRTPRNVNWRLRALVLMRDGARCQLCGATPQTGSRLHVDHIFPWSEGGETVFENLQILCDQCNIGKSDVVVSLGS